MIKSIFELLKTSGRARLGKLCLSHGEVDTPIFMPVGTAGCVKTLVPQDLNDLGAQIILGNTYHLFLRPGMDVIREFGGLHKFVNWKKPMLTDSGGFQVFSLANNRKLTEEGVHFQSHLDGTRFLFTPELAVEIQETLGSDIHMVLDECTPYPASLDVARVSMELSTRWAKRCRVAKQRGELAQFGIIQGGVHESLRLQSLQSLVDIGFEGYAIGGLSVGEPKNEMLPVIDYCTEHMPKDKPRYLMGVGTPLDLCEGVAMGVDMFDCVMPTRNGRNGTVFTSKGRLNIKTEKWKFSHEALDENCSCYTCRTFTKGYLRHLFMANEPTVQRLLSLHNLTYYLQLMNDMREAISDDTFGDLLKHHRDLWAQPASAE